SIELEGAGVEEVPPKPRQGHVPMPEYSLVLDIVNGEEATDLLVFGPCAIVLPQIHGNEPGLPIVGMDHIGPVIDHWQRCQRGSAKKHKASAIVRIISLLAVRKRELIETAPVGLVVTLEVIG